MTRLGCNLAEFVNRWLGATTGKARWEEDIRNLASGCSVRCTVVPCKHLQPVATARLLTDWGG